MRDRIKKIMDAEDMNPARFADSLQIGRAVISHILNGRNNPSLDVITRILTQMPYINSDWLLTGIEPMYKSDIENKSNTSTYRSMPDLFSNENQIYKHSENSINQNKLTEDIKYNKENAVENLNSDTEIQNTVKEKIIYRETPSKKIRQIIIYYTDNTFETFSTN